MTSPERDSDEDYRESDDAASEDGSPDETSAFADEEQADWDLLDLELDDEPDPEPGDFCPDFDDSFD